MMRKLLINIIGLKNFWYSLVIFSFGVILGLSLMQWGAFYSVDSQTYTEFTTAFIQSDFTLSSVANRSQSWSYSLLAFPFVKYIHNLGVDIVYSFRLVNILAFGLTAVTIFHAVRFFVRRSIAVMTAVLYTIATPAIAIAIDVWQQNFSLLGGSLIIVSALYFYKNQRWQFAVLNAIGFSFLYYSRPFEVPLYMPFFMLFPLAFYLRYRRKDQKKDAAKQISLTLVTWVVIALTFLLPLFNVNKLVYNNILGIYSAQSSDEIQGNFSVSLKEFLYRSSQKLIHYSVDFHPDTPAQKTILAILEASPFLILSFFGMFFAFRKHGLIAACLILTFAAELVFYISWAYWSDGWTPAIRYLLVTFPILCILFGIAIDRLTEGVKRKRDFLVGVGLCLAVGFILILIFRPFFEKYILQNIGIMNPRTEIKLLGAILWTTLAAVSSIFLMMKKFPLSFRTISSVVQGAIVGILAFSIAGSIFANVFSAGLSVRYGLNVYPIFKTPFFEFLHVDFMGPLLPICWTIFYSFVAMLTLAIIVLSLSRLLPVKQQDH